MKSDTYDTYGRKIIAVTAFIECDGAVLAVSRRNKPTDIGLPGGKVEPGETLEEALMRELKEEVGITPTVFREVYDRPDHKNGSGETGWNVCRCFYVSEYEGIPIPMEEGIHVFWVKPETLADPSNTFGEYNSDLLKQLEFDCENGNMNLSCFPTFAPQIHLPITMKHRMKLSPGRNKLKFKMNRIK